MIKKWLFLAIALLVGTATSAQVGIGSPAPHPSARLELDATDKGFLPPRLTTQQRDEIANPAEGLTIYNTTINCLEFWNGTMWYNPCCPAPMQPSEIAGESEPCIGTSLIYSVVEVDGVSYNWTTPGNWVVTNGAGTHQITVTVGSDSGSIEVVPSNDCGNGSGRTLVATPRTVASTPSAEVHAPDINSITWQWSEVAGADGYRHNTVDDFDTATDTSNASFNQEGLDCETEYTLYVWAYNDCGQSTTLALTESTLDCPPSGFVCGDNVADIDGNTYQTVQIGDQCWMKQNLKTTKYQDGTDIGTDFSGTDGAYAWVSNHFPWKDSYGALYNWYAVDEPRGLCPEGWVVASHNDWTTLTDYLKNNFAEITSSNVSNKLKSCRVENSPLGGECNTTEHPFWAYNDTNYGTDDFGFSAVPAGHRHPNGSFANRHYNGFWWTSTAFSSIRAYTRTMFHMYGNIPDVTYPNANGYSTRCIKVEAP